MDEKPRILETLERLRDPQSFPAPEPTDFDLLGTTTLRTLRAELDDPRFTLDAVAPELEARKVTAVVHPRGPEGDLAWIDATFGGGHAIDLAASETIAFHDDRGIVAVVGFATTGRPLPWLRNLREPGDAIVGPVLVSPRANDVRAALRRLLLACALTMVRVRGARHALVHGLADRADVAEYERDANARTIATYDLAAAPRRRVALLSSACADFVAHVDDEARRRALPIEIAGFVTCTPDEFHVEYTAARGIVPAIVPWHRTDGETRESFADRVAAALLPTEPDLVALLGWDYVLPPSFIERFPQLVNLHGGLLPLDPDADVLTDPTGRQMPAIRGLHPTQDSFAAGMRWTGSTFHRVTSEVDRGEVLARTPTALDRARTSEGAVILVAAGALRTCSTGIMRWAVDAI